MPPPSNLALELTDSMRSGPATPLPAQERIQALDVLRGAALAGIFVMNMPGFSASFHIPHGESPYGAASLTAADERMMMLMGWLLEGRFNGLFSLLFGIGLMLQIQRLEGQRGLITRRMLALLAIGALHTTLLWGGDVLHVYAVFGLLLMGTVKWSRRTWGQVVALLFAAQVAHGALGLALWSPQSHEAEQIFLASEQARDNTIYGAGTWLQGVALRAEQAVASYLNPHLAWPIAWFWISLMNTAALGIWALRSGWLEADGPRQRWLASAEGAWALVALFIAGSLAWHASNLLLQDFDPAVRGPSWREVLGWSMGDLARMVLVATYATAVLRLCLTGRATALRGALAQVGRMPLSQYLLQSLLGTFIFHGWGLGLWGQLGPLAQTLLALGLFALVQVPLSLWWLRRHELGPLEALWRRLTYGSRG